MACRETISFLPCIIGNQLCRKLETYCARLLNVKLKAVRISIENDIILQSLDLYQETSYGIYVLRFHVSVSHLWYVINRSIFLILWFSDMNTNSLKRNVDFTRKLQITHWSDSFIRRLWRLNKKLAIKERVLGLYHMSVALDIKGYVSKQSIMWT